MRRSEAITRYSKDIGFGILVHYVDADKFFVVNDDDPDLKPVKIRLPEPPDWHLIAGFGEKARDQYFKKSEYPARLIELQNKVVQVLSDEKAARQSQTLTAQKIVDEMWEQLSLRRTEYESEITWLKNEIWHLHYGYWFFNNGKPTYIDGWHYRFLNYWDMTDANVQYRDRDRRWFLFNRYAYTCTEDEWGHDMGGRVCFGIADPKHRRAGDTHKSLCIGFDIMSKTIGSVGGGIQSFDDNNARDHYQSKLIPAFKGMPFFLKPIWKGSQAPQSELHFTRVDNRLGDELGCKFDFATTAYLTVS